MYTKWDQANDSDLGLYPTVVMRLSWKDIQCIF